MALQQYRIPEFLGINQSACENNIHAGESPDARNMDTDGGRLAVARGYVRHCAPAHPSPESVLRLAVWHKDGVRRFVTATADGLQVLDEDADAWQTLATFAAPAVQADFQTLKIASTEYLLMAGGAQQIVKWDGASAAAAFGSAEQLSDAPVGLLELYYGRLFAAGDPNHPCRLYWSCAPGDERTVEDWSQSAASENVGGGHVEVGTDSDPITGLFALSNQLLIFKRDSLYRLLGDRPGNYRIYPVNASMAQPVHTACVRVGDVLYFLTETGMYYFDGQTVRRAADADKIKAFLADADLSDCRGAACRDRLYFAVKTGGSAVNNALVTYDLPRGTYMVRDGFTIHGLQADGGVLFLLAGDGRVCRFDEGDSYDGAEIRAYWRTPMTDLGGKIAVKQLRELYLRGSGGVIAVEAISGGATVFFDRLMPASPADVLEAPLSGDGRAFCLRLSNENGARFTVDGGVELLLDAKRRVL